MIFILSGNQGCGKDTVGDILVDKHKFIKLSFAGCIKDMVSIIFGYDREMLEGKTKEQREQREIKDEWWSSRLGFEISPRILLQKIGTDIMRENFNDKIWIYVIEKKLEKYINVGQNIVITDCRFKNEYETLKKMGGYSIKIERGRKQEEKKYVHKSEIEWKSFNFDYVIDNNGSIKDLKLGVKKILNEIIQSHLSKAV